MVYSTTFQDYIFLIAAVYVCLSVIPTWSPCLLKLMLVLTVRWCRGWTGRALLPSGALGVSWEPCISWRRAYICENVSLFRIPHGVLAVCLYKLNICKATTVQNKRFLKIFCSPVTWVCLYFTNTDLVVVPDGMHQLFECHTFCFNSSFKSKMVVI